MDAILAGIHTSSTKSMLEELEHQREQLQLSILQAKLRRPVYTREMIIRWINQFKNGNMEDMTYRKRIIDIFVNAVYVYEDKLVFTYNFRDGNETVSLADIELALGSHSSDISDSTSPKIGKHFLGLPIFTYSLFTFHSSLDTGADFWEVIGNSE